MRRRRATEAWLVVLVVVLASVRCGGATSSRPSEPPRDDVAATTTVMATSVATASGTPEAATPSPTATSTPGGQTQPPARRVVVLDPGHGGDDPGAASFGIVERESNLDMAERIGTALRERGIEVVLTRATADRPRVDGRDATLAGATATFLDLQDRIAIANAAQADVFVSIHSNGCVNPDASGVEVWFDSTRSFAEANRSLAEAVLSGIEARAGTSGVAVPVHGLEDDVGVADIAGHTTPLFVLGPTREVTWEELMGRGIEPSALGVTDPGASFWTDASTMPGVLVELLYVTNPSDAALLANDDARSAMATGVADGIARYLGQLAANENRSASAAGGSFVTNRTVASAPRPPAGCAPR